MLDLDLSFTDISLNDFSYILESFPLLEKLSIYNTSMDNFSDFSESFGRLKPTYPNLKALNVGFTRISSGQHFGSSPINDKNFFDIFQNLEVKKKKKNSIFFLFLN